MCFVQPERCLNDHEPHWVALSIGQALTDLVGDSGLDEAPEGHGSLVGHMLILSMSRDTS